MCFSPVLVTISGIKYVEYCTFQIVDGHICYDLMHIFLKVILIMQETF
jgi:hypothetical protein